MNNAPDLSSIFGRFAGKEIEMIETPREVELKALGMTHKYVELTLAKTPDPVITDMESEAKKNGLNLRLWFPDSVGTADYRTDRVNAHVAKEADGKYRVQKNFGIG